MIVHPWPQPVNPTKAAVEKRARELGAHVSFHRDRDMESPEHEITIEAPDGKVFKGTGTHGVVVRGDVGSPWADLYLSALGDMEHGLAECDDEDCDTCGGDQ